MKKETPPSIFVEGNPPLFILMILTIILYDDVENISRFYEFILILECNGSV